MAVARDRTRSYAARVVRAAIRPSVRRYAAMSWMQLGSRLLLLLVVLLPSVVCTASLWGDTSTYGFHDWDVMASHRYLAKVSILDHGEFPGWNPFACGGFPAWGYVEGGTTVVSPLLPLYLLCELPLALRLEILLMGWLGAWGSERAASRWTKSLAGRALVVALFAINGRFGLQAAAGHTWHLAYALLPWALYYFQRALAAPRWFADGLKLGVVFAWLVYAGGIYPLPHTILALTVLAAVEGGISRSFKPLTVLAVGGLWGIGLAAPKLLPMLATFARAPRLIESNEQLSLTHLWIALTSQAQGFYQRPAPVRPYGWHEWGIYIGTSGAVLLLLGTALVWRKKAWGVKLAALLFVLLGLGAFHPLAPWPWMHEHLPVFRSQHVPSRFLYPAILLAALGLASGVGPLLRRFGRRVAWADFALALAALGLALDIAAISAKPMSEAFWMVPPPELARSAEFSFAERAPVQYLKRDWAEPMYLSMLANTGVIRCYGTPPFEGVGALAKTHPRYRGEVEFERPGQARISHFSPNRIEVETDAVPPGTRVLVNMNKADGWEASAQTEAGERKLQLLAGDRLAAFAPEGARTLTFRYSPPYLAHGLMVAACSLTFAGYLSLRRRWERR
jgi:hypothetical protein